ncbi:hypothetical protein EHF33_20785 (plasmid) [Deinococcus psychrotolerans]|uniref:Uncharacterized protein n=1 Tax=Deinococcus psychrotolerans TaxID=2489213 RepID=A0A3G8YJA9_9DEIO|nr:hypothetical protein [Deinococcus psychrotolerans]AZI45349.1 hypothetical protein EHF33_20785 [Deinococcus psychrotolerans]
MISHYKTHIVVRDSIEHRLLASASVRLPRTRRQLLVIAIDHGMKLYDDQTVVTALRRLSGTGLLQANRGGTGALHIYSLTPQGEQVLQALAQT